MLLSAAMKTGLDLILNLSFNPYFKPKCLSLTKQCNVDAWYKTVIELQNKFQKTIVGDHIGGKYV